ncbi:aspartate--tRNA ligase [Ruminococcaceae bacterium OttesenSCG-928-A16]|nr:aspartate--tRNA ligase [Ruminococcaceae bacterium OttesenSCG-928-A16]
MDKMGDLRRTHYSDEINVGLVGQTITVAGSIAKSRDLGGVIFADLRDTAGIIQLSFGDGTDKAVFEKAASLRAEYVVMAQGTLQKRESVNKALPTGEVELFVTDLRLLSGAETPPFEIRDDLHVKDELRLKYRYLDLRRENLHNALVLRSRIAACVREFYLNQRFVEVETPVLIKSTPEGARDYLVPSRVQPGRFYALPQSPQLYKQILMLSGFDKYFQIARCFRDEDLRADRQPEFTQIDMEMSFADEVDVQTVNENLVKEVFSKVLGIDVPTPFLRMPYSEAMERFGSDKPDTRFGLELCNVSDVVKNSEFGVFANAIAAGGSVRLINAKGLADTLSRKEIDRLTETAKTYGAKGLAYLRLTADAETSSYEKFLSDDEKAALRTAAGAETGDVLLLVADADDVVFAALGALRQEIAKKQGLIPEGTFNFLWVTDFPLFEYSEEDGRFVAKHHPFTMPKEEDLDLVETNPGACRAKAYDMVVNGMELGGGSIRINDPVLQARMFKALGFTEEAARQNFGFLMDAYHYGAPPHGGMAFGFDRMVMLMLGKDSIRDVIAFPKVQNAGELMTGCPDLVEEKQLKELSIESLAKPEQTE